MAVGGPTGELDLGDQLGADPMDVGGRTRGAGPCERALVGASAFSLGSRPMRLSAAEPGADPADMDEMVAAVDADHQGAELPAGIGPGADDQFVATAALGLGPGLAATRAVRGVGLLGDDPLQRQLAGREQDGFAARVEVLDVAQ